MLTLNIAAWIYSKGRTSSLQTISVFCQLYKREHLVLWIYILQSFDLNNTIKLN